MIDSNNRPPITIGHQHTSSNPERLFSVKPYMEVPYVQSAINEFNVPKKKLHTFNVDTYNDTEIYVPKSVNFLDVIQWHDTLSDVLYTKLLIEYNEGDEFDGLMTVKCHTGEPYSEIKPHECYISSVVEFGIIKAFYVS